MQYVHFFRFSLPLAFWFLTMVDRGALLRYRRRLVLRQDIDAIKRVRVREAIFALMISLGFWYSIGTPYLQTPTCLVIFFLFLLQAIEPDAVVPTRTLAGAK